MNNNLHLIDKLYDFIPKNKLIEWAELDTKLNEAKNQNDDLLLNSNDVEKEILDCDFKMSKALNNLTDI